MRVAVWLQPTDWVPTSPARRGATPESRSRSDRMMVAMGFSPWCGRQCSPRRGATLANAIKRWIIRGFLRSGGRVSVILQVNG